MKLDTAIQIFTSKTSRRALAVVAAGALLLPASSSFADAGKDLMDALSGGKATFNLRTRAEIADAEGLSEAQAYTARLRVGYGTAAYHGFSAYADMEHIGAVSERKYWDKNGPNTFGETAIADPEDTQLNQAYLKFQSDDLGLTVIGGRQRIILDDSRFVGNVGWRQNEQTYDAVTLKGSFGVKDLELFYSYIFDVKRIFGDQGTNVKTRDFDSESHLINASYSGLPFGKVTAFAYILDFNKSAFAKGNSSNTYGVRLAGKQKFSDDLSLGYQGSYAYQVDGGGNPADYKAHYLLADVNLGFKPAGQFGIGYELQSSDHGMGSFTTPLATLHKFNGFADVFLTSNSTGGLEDSYVYYAAPQFFGIKAKIAYHRFDSDVGGTTKLGEEVDVVVSRGFWDKRMTLLGKIAYFDGANGMPDISRYWLETTFAF
jgi:hypothetical protein